MLMRICITIFNDFPRKTNKKLQNSAFSRRFIEGKPEINKERAQNPIIVKIISGSSDLWLIPRRIKHEQYRCNLGHQQNHLFAES